MIDIKKLLTKTLIALAGKQNTLVSGTNIKTVNNTSLLGSGNIATPDTTYAFSRQKHTSGSQSQAKSSQSVHYVTCNNSNKAGTTNISDYTPMAITGIHFNGDGVGQLVPYGWWFNSSGTGTCEIGIGVRNNNSNNTISFTIDVYILWRKTT